MNLQSTKPDTTVGATHGVAHPQPSVRAVPGRRPARTTAIIALASGVLMLSCLEAGARFFAAVAQPNLGRSRIFDAKYAISRRPATMKPGLVFIGGSFINRAFYPELIAREFEKQGLSLEVRNLGSGHSVVEEHIFLLDNAVKSGMRPAAVVCDLRPIAFEKLFQPMLKSEYEELSQSYLGSCFIKPDNSPKGKFETWLKKNFYLIRFRAFFGQQIKTAFDKIFGSEDRLLPNPSEKSLMPSEFGWLADSSIVDPENVQAIKANNLRNYFRAYGKQEPGWTARNIQPLVDYCQKNKLPLILIWLPEAEQKGSVTARYQGSVGRRFVRNLGEYIGQYQNIYFVNHHDAEPDPAKFADPMHLNVRGSIDESNRLVRLLTSEQFSWFRDMTQKLKAGLSPPEDERR